MGQDLSESCHFSHPGREGGSGFWCDLDSYRWMRHTACVSSFLGNRYMNLFLYKETHFFGFIQFSSLLAQLCYLVAHPVGTVFPRADEDHHLRVHSCCQTSLQIVLPNTATREASCYQTAPSTVDLFGNRSTSCGPAPRRCWVTAAYSARESSLCRRSRQSTSIAWYGMSRRAAMRFTPFIHEFSVGWLSRLTQPGGFSCYSGSPPSTFKGSADTSLLGRKSECAAASTGSPTGICRASSERSTSARLQQ